jgi:hypothetical protein
MLSSEIAKKKIIFLHDVTNKSNHSAVNLATYVLQSSSELEHVLWGDKSCRSVGAYRLRNILSPFSG